MAGFVSPDGLLLIPLLAVAAQCLEAFATLDAQRLTGSVDSVIFGLFRSDASINTTVQVALDKLFTRVREEPASRSQA